MNMRVFVPCPGFLGVAVCLCFRRSKLIRGLEANDKD